MTATEVAAEPCSGRQDEPQQGPALTIVNEFSTVVVRKRLTRNGERLEIESPRFRILLDALALEAVSWQSPDAISACLETPFGPEPAGEER